MKSFTSFSGTLGAAEDAATCVAAGGVSVGAFLMLVESEVEPSLIPPSGSTGAGLGLVAIPVALAICAILTRPPPRALPLAGFFFFSSFSVATTLWG